MKLHLAYLAITLLASLSIASRSYALVVIDVTEEVGGVTFTLSGSIDLTGLGSPGFGGNPAHIAWDNATSISLTGDSGVYNNYSATGVSDSGTPTGVFQFSTTTVSGTDVIFIRTDGIIAVPVGYVSNAPLNLVTLISGSTFASLGLPATFSRTLSFTAPGGGDSITFQSSAVPEPATALPLLALTLCFGWMRGRVSNATKISA